jgi:hypothetical protein
MQPLIAVINTVGPDDAVHRMKSRPLRNHLPHLSFMRPSLVTGRGERDTGDQRRPAGVVLRIEPSRSHVDHVFPWLRERRLSAVIMMHLPDFWPAHRELLHALDEVIDVYMVATPEMRSFVAPFTERRVAVLIDPIDFGLEASFEHPVRASPGPLRVMWFGYPDSFQKSMSGYLPILESLCASGEIEFHLVTRESTYGRKSFYTVHHYDPATFIDVARQFDICLLSHQPFDFSVATAFKSENKAVLAMTLGLPVAASRTPAYRRLLLDCGLGDFLFSSQADLVAVLRRLSDQSTRLEYLRACQARVLQAYGARQMANDWQGLFEGELRQGRLSIKTP